MNIQEAKKEICNTLRAYLAKDEDGDYSYPMVRQRPILLIGPPGIGKTAIMEQAATECGVRAGILYHYPSYPPECHRSAGNREAQLWWKGNDGHRLYHE